MNCVRSWERIKASLFRPIHFKWPFFLVQFVIKARRTWFNMEQENKKDPIMSLITSPAYLYTAMWAKKMKFIWDIQRVDSSVRWSCYEDIVTHREHCIAAIFEYCGLDKALSELGVRALDYDSQKGINKKQVLRLSTYGGGIQITADQICEWYDVPKLNVDNSKIPGRLVVEKKNILQVTKINYHIALATLPSR